MQPNPPDAPRTPDEWAPVLGPADRVTFLQEQARRRRDTWRLTALCALVVGLTGIPMSAVITPILFLIVVVVLRGFGAPPWILDGFREAARTTFEGIEFLVDNLDRMAVPELLRASGSFAPGLSFVFLPGALVSLLMWLGLCGLMIRSGVGSALMNIGVREPRRDDLEELQLVNVVHEMAIAAGLPPPNVVLVDADVTNAVAIGSSPKDATLIVTRRLLDEFDRQETQGILGHLIGSIGNGDLRIAILMVAVFQTLGLFLTVLDAPFSGPARSTLWRLLGAALGSLAGRKPGAGSGADTLGILLMEGLGTQGADEAGEIMEAAHRKGLNPIHSLLLKARMVVLIPSILLSLFMKMQQFLFVSIILGPALALTWRARRYLADASAVQLTRNPDGVRAGLLRLARTGGMVPGAQWASHLFVVGTEVGEQRSQARLQEEMAELRDQGGDKSGLSQIKEKWGPARGTVLRYAADVAVQQKGSLGDMHAVAVSFHPPMQERLKRLVAMGASGGVPIGRPAWWSSGSALIFAPLLALCGVLMAIALGLIFMLAVFADLVVIAVVLVIALSLMGAKL
jgi:Zn-dependent protease with chaperone function